MQERAHINKESGGNALLVDRVLILLQIPLLQCKKENPVSDQCCRKERRGQEWSQRAGVFHPFKSRFHDRKEWQRCDKHQFPDTRSRIFEAIS